MRRSGSNPGERHRAEARGRRAEALAALWLRLKFYRIRDARVRTPVGEIDLIAERFGTLAFVEVKARGAPTGEAEALEAVNAARIARAAEWYLMRHPALAARRMRFDVVFVAPGRPPRHLTNAFEAG